MATKFIINYELRGLNTMNKIFLSFLAVFFVLAATFVSAADLTVTDTVNTIGISVNPGASFSGSFKLNNINTAEAISNIDLSASTFTGPNTIPATAASFSPDPITSLAPNASQTVTFTMTMPANQLPGFFTGELKANDPLLNSTATPISFTVNSLSKLEVTDYSTSTPLKLTGEEDSIVSNTFTIKNSGNVDLALSTSSFTHNIDLTDGDNHNITLSFSSIPTILTPGATDAVTVTADIPNNMGVDVYSGIVTVASGTAAANFTLEISVQPEVCQDGPIGQLSIDINDPDNNDEFAPGEIIELDIDVDNNDNDQMDVGVTAFLYNIDQDNNIIEEDSKVIEIGDDDSENFNLELQLPLDGDLDESDKYKLFVKAYEDGDEDKNCAEDSIDIEIKREKHDTRIDEVALSPSIVSCGEVVESNIDVVNIGSSDENDVYVVLKNIELGLNEKSGEFKLDNGNDKDNDASESITFTVPSDADEKVYQIEAIVNYNDDKNDNSKFVALTVEDCGEEEPTDTTTGAPDEAGIEVLASSIEAKGSTFSIPIKITNNADEQKTYSIGMANVVDWAEEPSDKTLTLNGQQSSTVYFYVKANKDVSGKQSATVNVKDSATGKISATQTITLDLGEQAAAQLAPTDNTNVWDTIKGYFTGSNATVFWVILDVVLVVVAILVIKLLFMKKKQ